MFSMVKCVAIDASGANIVNYFLKSFRSYAGVILGVDLNFNLLL